MCERGGQADLKNRLSARSDRRTPKSDVERNGLSRLGPADFVPMVIDEVLDVDLALGWDHAQAAQILRPRRSGRRDPVLGPYDRAERPDDGHQAGRRGEPLPKSN